MYPQIRYKIFFLDLDKEGTEQEINHFIMNNNVKIINEYYLDTQDSKKKLVFVIQYYVNNQTKKLLFDHLRAWRLAFSKERGIPAYVVFKDDILNEIVRTLPRNKEQLAKIQGMGEHKIKDFGDEIILKIREFYQNEKNK